MVVLPPVWARPTLMLNLEGGEAGRAGGGGERGVGQAGGQGSSET